MRNIIESVKNRKPARIVTITIRCEDENQSVRIGDFIHADMASAGTDRAIISLSGEIIAAAFGEADVVTA